MIHIVDIHCCPQRHVNLKELLDQHDLLLDIIVPFRQIEGSPEHLVGRKHVESHLRPLVHLFVIQEDLEFDSLTTVLRFSCNLTLLYIVML